MSEHEFEAMNAMFGTMNMFAGLIGLISVIALWKIFTKAGEDGWKAIIPFYNVYVLTKLVTGNGLLFLVLLIPIVNIFFGFYLYHKLAQSFGKGIGFTIGLILLNPVFMLILAFGDAQYESVKA